jgi:methylenetetrahydrofolate reductase (NADPH)
MNGKPGQDAAAQPAERELREAIGALARQGSIETTARNPGEIDGYPFLVPKGSDVYAAWTPGMPAAHIVSVAGRLRRMGMNPVPHIAARKLPDAAAAAALLARLRDEAGVTRVLLVAGDGQAAFGPYASSLALLETGLLEAHGIRGVGVAGYPEGHPQIPEAALWEALERKADSARRRGIELYLVAQFCFDGQAVLAWLRRLRARGIAAPVRVGVAGPATVRTLLNYGMRCGIGTSLRALPSRAVSLTRLLARHGPEDVVYAVARAEAGLNIAGLHVFPFGGFAQSAQWLRDVAAGRFELNAAEDSFRIKD